MAGIRARRGARGHEFPRAAQAGRRPADRMIAGADSQGARAGGGNADVLLTVFVACFNEEQNITETLDTLLDAMAAFDFPWEAIVIDDASTDGSVRLIRDYIERHPQAAISLKVNAVNMGLSENYVDAAFLGRGKYYRLVCGDNVEPRETLIEVFRHIGSADMVIPYQVHCEGRPFLRVMLSRLYTGIINGLSGNRIRYYNGLALHLRQNVMRFHSRSSGFNFQAELITTLLDRGFSYVEIPVTARERQSGNSTALTLRNLLSVANSLLELVLRRIRKALFGR